MTSTHFLDYDGLDGVFPAKKGPFFKHKYFLWIGMGLLLVGLLMFLWFKKVKSASKLTSKPEVSIVSNQKSKIKDYVQKQIASSESHNILSVPMIGLDQEQSSSVFNNYPVIQSKNLSWKEVKKGALSASEQFSDKQTSLDKKGVITDNNFEKGVDEGFSQAFLFKYSFTRVNSLSTDDSKRLSNFVSKCSNKINIIGHTCGFGSAAFNYKLGLIRASSMQQYLIKQGVNPAVLSIRSEGKNKPVGNNATKLGRRLNRRVELLCIKSK